MIESTNRREFVKLCGARTIRNAVFQNLRINKELIWEGMAKPA
jgi:hypothetical protein